MVRTLIFFLCFGVSLGLTWFILLVRNLLAGMGAIRAAAKLTHLTSYYWARLLVWVAGIKVEVHGLENIPEEPALFVSNHQGNFDIPVLLGHINKPKGFLAKIELAKIPIMRTWMDKMGCVFIDRGDLRQSIKAIQKCAQVLKGGQSLVVFPEGTRSRGKAVGEFKRGTLRMVEKVDVPIVPIAIQGTSKAMEENNNRITPSKVILKVFPPVRYKLLTEEERVGINSLVRDIIVDGMKES